MKIEFDQNKIYAIVEGISFGLLPNGNVHLFSPGEWIDIEIKKNDIKELITCLVLIKNSMPDE